MLVVKSGAAWIASPMMLVVVTTTTKPKTIVVARHGEEFIFFKMHEKGELIVEAFDARSFEL